ncbi:hypothetical protein Tco_1199855 [Tanacetum coccineum]
MLDSDHSTVTYTSISNDYEESSDVGSPRIVVYGYNGLPMHPPSPDYMPGPEHPPSPDYVPGPEHPPLPVYVSYVPEPAYPEFMPPEDDEDDEDPEEDPTDKDDEEEESSRDDADNEEEDEDEDEDEKEEHLAPADSVPPPAYRTTARMFIRAQTHILFPSEVEVDRLLAIPTPPPSPLTSYSSPLSQIPSPPLPISPTHPLGYKAAMIRLRTESPSTSHPLPLPPPIVLPRTPPLLPIPLPIASPPLLLPFTNCRADVPEVMLPPRKRLCIALGPRYETRECSSALTTRPTGGFKAVYGFVSTMDAEIRRDPDRELELGQRMTDFVTIVRQDTYEIYGRLDDAQDDRSLMSGPLNLLRRDRCSYARTARLMKSEARASREDWTEIRDLWAADRRRQAQLVEPLTLLSTLLTQMVALQSQQRPARDPTHPDVPDEAGSSS